MPGGLGAGAGVELALAPTVESVLTDIPHEHLPAGEVEATAAIGDLLAGPDAFKGRLFRCDNTVEPLPVLWAPVRPAGATPGPPPSDASGLLDSDALARHRLTLFCKTEELATVAVQVYFGTETSAAVLQIGKQSHVALRLLGLGPAGQLLARYVALTAHPRPAPVADPDRPDWLGTLVSPAAWVHHAVRCTAAGAPLVRPDKDVEAPATAALIALAAANTATDGEAAARVPGVLAELSCADARGLDVPVLAWFSTTAMEDALRIGAGTRVDVEVLGAADNRVVGVFAGLGTGAMPVQAGDLRRIWLRPESSLGREVECVSLGLPLAQTVDTLDADDALLQATAVSRRKTWLACAQRPLPPVHMSLYFKMGAEQELLSLGRGTRVAAKVLGVRGGRILASYIRVVSAPTKVAERAQDLRRFALLPEAMVGKRLSCSLLRDLERASREMLPETARSLSKYSTPGQAWLATCGDALRPYEGQRFAVYWPGLRRIDAPRAGTQIDLRFDGLANDVPVADYIADSAGAP